MRGLGTALLLLFGLHAAAAEQCGLYQIEDYGERTVYSISDFTSQRPMVLNYRITNVDGAAVGSLINGLCYCVEGEVSPDPAYPNDGLYKLLQVTRVKQGPWQNCVPTK